MIPLHAEQAALVRGGTLATVPLVTLTTYTDRDAATVDTVFRFSNGDVVYNSGSGAKPFKPFVQTLSRVRRSMRHLPDPAALDPVADAITVTLSNGEWLPGQRLWEVLRVKTLAYATVEVSQLLVPVQRLNADAVPPWWDLRGVTAGSHIVRFRGELLEAEATLSAIELRFGARMPQVPWAEALDADTTDPQDFGSRLPLVYGRGVRVPAAGLVVGRVATLSVSILESYTGLVSVSATEGMPATGTFTVAINTEDVTASVVGAFTLSVTARGQNGTQAVSHSVGAIVVERVASVKLGLSGIAGRALRALYVRSPVADELVHIASDPFVFDGSDTVSVSGRTIATAEIPAEALREVISQLFVDAEVSRQAAYTTAGSPTANIFTPADYVLDDTGFVGNSVIELSVSSSTGNMNLSRDSSIDGAGHIARRIFSAGQGLPTTAYTRKRFVFRLKINSTIPLPDSFTFAMEWIGFAGIANGALLRGTNVAGLSPEYVLTSAWFPGGSNLAADMIGAQFRFRFSLQKNNPNSSWTPDNVPTSAYAELQAGWGVEVEGIAVPTVSIIADAEITAASVGFGLRWYADIEGPAVPAGTDYGDVTEGDLIEHGPNVLRHLIAEVCGLGHDAIDDTTFGQALDRLTQGARLFPMDIGAGDWTPQNATLSNDLVVAYKGGALKCVGDGGASGGNYIGASRTDLGGTDVTGVPIVLWVRVDSALYAALDEVTAFHLSIGSGSDWNNFSTWGRPKVAIPAADTWVRLLFDPEEPPFYTNGAVDLTQVTRIWLQADCTPNSTSGKTVWFDEVWFEHFDRIAGNAAGLGQTFGQVCASLAHQMRANLVVEERTTGSVYRLLAATKTGTFGASARTLRETWDVREARISSDELGSAHRAFYALDASRGEDGEGGYLKHVRADEVQNDAFIVSLANLQATQAAIGRRVRDPLFLSMVQNDLTAADVLGYYANERRRFAARVFHFKCSPAEAGDLERGDIVSLVTPWGSTVKLRITLVDVDLLRPVVELEGVEVL